MTNFDKIKDTRNVEEMAKIIVNAEFCTLESCIPNDVDCERCVKHWLESEVQEDE